MHGLESFDLVAPIIKSTTPTLFYVFLIPPVYYLFFENLLFKKTRVKKEIILFGIALLTIVITITLNFSALGRGVVFLSYSTAYLLIFFKVFYGYLFKTKYGSELTHYHSIKNWAIIMGLLFIMTYVFANYIFLTFSYEAQRIIISKYLTATSILWLLIVGYIFMNPMIMYGEQLRLRKVNQTATDELKIWSSKKIKDTDAQDLEIEKKIADNVQVILLNLKNYETTLFKEFKEIPTLQKLSNALKFPQSHLKYVFKYYCASSFKEYQNKVCIKYALHLIDLGYLDLHTLESLATKCHYSNRSTFFKNFKKFTGYSPSEYILTLSKEQKIIETT